MTASGGLEENNRLIWQLFVSPNLKIFFYLVSIDVFGGPSLAPQ